MANRAWWQSFPLWPVLILVATFIAYSPALRAGFVWDDQRNVTGNQLLRTAEGLKQTWADPSASFQYYPLTYTVFWMEYHLWGLRPAGYHAVNIFLHALSAILLGVLLTRLSVPGAWLAALIFAVHPVHVESVAWVTELKNVLSGLFFLGAFLAYLRFLELPQRRWQFYAFALFLFLLALLGKTSTVSLPIIILVVVWWKCGRVKGRDVWPVVPFFLLAIPLGVLTTWIEKHYVGAQGPEWQMSLVERFLIAGRVVWFYAGKLLWPHPLMFVYPRWQINAAVWWQFLFPVATIAAILIFWFLRKHWGKGPFVAMLFYVGMVAPVPAFFNLYFMNYSYVADHFQYLGSIGLIALAAAGVTVVLRNRAGRMAVTMPALVVLGALSWHHCLVFQNEEVLWRDTIAKDPGCWMAHNNLGNVLLREGEFSDAIGHYEQALRIKPDDAKAHNNLGIALAQTGKIEEAIAHYQQALRIKPDYAQVHYNLGSALTQMGKTEEAIAHYQQALRINPDFTQAQNALARVQARP